jgi:hypothetical protein
MEHTYLDQYVHWMSEQARLEKLVIHAEQKVEELMERAIHVSLLKLSEINGLGECNIDIIAQKLSRGGLTTSFDHSPLVKVILEADEIEGNTSCSLKLTFVVESIK